MHLINNQALAWIRKLNFYRSLRGLAYLFVCAQKLIFSATLAERESAFAAKTRAFSCSASSAQPFILTWFPSRNA